MKKWIALLIVSTSFINMGSYANEISFEAKKLNQEYPHHLYFGPEIFLFDLKTQRQDVTVKGLKFFGGLRLRYEYLKPKAFYAGVDLFSAASPKGFHGALEGYQSHKNKKISGLSNFEVRLGYTLASKNGITTPFLGIGGYSVGNNGNYFNWRENIGYYAAGVRSLFDLNCLMSIGYNVKLFRTADTDWKFKYLSSLGKITVTDKDNLWGGEIGLPIVWHLGDCRKWDVQVEPYFLKLDFSEKQNIYGTRFLVGYRF